MTLVTNLVAFGRATTTPGSMTISSVAFMQIPRPSVIIDADVFEKAAMALGRSRPNNLVSRRGGDEFAALAPNTAEPATLALAQRSVR